MGEGFASVVEDEMQVHKIVCQAQYCCQRKMQGNYPSVAKACTFASLKGRPNRFDASEQKANQAPEIYGLFMGLAVGVAGVQSSSPVCQAICRRFGPSC